MAYPLAIGESMKSPLDYEWQYGPIPKVEDVPYDCIIILWSDKGYIGYVFPHGDALNPLRWADHSYHPSWGTGQPEGWWTWYDRGGKKERPPEVKTWAEKYERPEQLAWEKHREECEQCRKIQEKEMAQSCNSRLRASDMKDYSNDYCAAGQVILKALYKMYEIE